MPEDPAPENGLEALPPLPPSEPASGQEDAKHRHKHKRKHRDQDLPQEDLPASRRSRAYEDAEPAVPAAYSNDQAVVPAAEHIPAEVRSKERDADGIRDKDRHQHRSERKHKSRDAELDAPSRQEGERHRERDLHRHKDKEGSRRHRDGDRGERHKFSKGRDRDEDRGSRRHRHDGGRDDRSKR